MRIIIEIDGANVASAKLEEPGYSGSSSPSGPLAAAAVDSIFDAGQAALETGLTAEPTASSASVFDAGAAKISS